METQSATSQSLDDLVFENRNKAYGAYAIRRSYADNVNKALIYALFSSALIIVAPSIVSSFWKDPIKITQGPDIPLMPTHPPIIVPKEIPQVANAPAKTAAQKLLFQVTTKEVVDDVQNLTTASSEVVNKDATTSAVESFATTTLETPIVIPHTGPWDFVEEMPEYIGGQDAMIRYLQRKLRYPFSAIGAGTQGIVFVIFVINTDGKVIRPEVIKGISKECDAEAVRVISQMPALESRKAKRHDGHGTNGAAH